MQDRAERTRQPEGWSGFVTAVLSRRATHASVETIRKVSCRRTDPSVMHQTCRLWLSSHILPLAIAVAAGAALTSCTQVQVAPDVRGEYEFGALQVFVDTDFIRAYDASKRGMKDIGLFQTADDRKVIEAELNGRDSVDTKVVVKIKEVGKNRVSVKIRYGLVRPDLPAAQKLFQAIQKHI
jgi:hypothetical protein